MGNRWRQPAHYPERSPEKRSPHIWHRRPRIITPQGQDAKWHLINTIKRTNRTADCLVVDIDKYNRRVSVCSIILNGKSVDIGEHMLSNGYARVYRRYLNNKYAPVGLKQRYLNYGK